MALIQCSSCDRHVRSGETTCPFCGAAILRPAPMRAGLAMMTLAIPLAMASCRSMTKYGGPPPPEPDPIEQTTAADPAQDSSDPEPDEGGAEAGEDDRVVAPMYGAPPPQPEDEPRVEPTIYGGPPAEPTDPG